MLVITRRAGESIVIGVNKESEIIEVEVVVLGIRKRQIRLGIIAPREIAIHRTEIYQRNLEQLEKEQADLQESPLSTSE